MKAGERWSTRGRRKRKSKKKKKKKGQKTMKKRTLGEERKGNGVTLQ